MNKLVILFFIISTTVLQAQYKPDTTAKKWFPDAKYGVFIHWTLDYSHKNRLSKDYNQFRTECNQQASKLTASEYKPEEWAKNFKKWGANYVVLTTKHHLGFALYDRKGSIFTAANSTPAKRDLLKEYCEAVRKEGMKVGLYFSLPDYTHPDYLSLIEEGKKVDWKNADFVAWKRFTDYMLEDIKHLVTAYGKIDLIWFDGDWEHTADFWRSSEIMDTINKYQPWVVVNNRLRSADYGDYSTPEMVIPLQAPKGWFELCTTLAYNWDGPDAEKSLKAPSETVRILGDILTMGGNLLLNVSPDNTGKISKNQIDKMNQLGTWISEHKEAIYGTQSGLPLGLFNGGSTHRGSTIYLIAYETAPELVIKNIEGDIETITHLKTGTPLKWRNMDDYHSDNNRKGWRFISLPTQLVEQYGTVIKITFKDKKVRIKNPDKTYLDWVD